MYKILIIDDEPNMRSGLKDNLEFEDYEVETACDGEEGLSKILNSKYDLVLLDVMMPKMNGFDVCKKVRAEKNNVPIILLTAKGEEIDKVLGLEFGADDYIAKPFSLRELLARVKAVLRRSSLSYTGEISPSNGGSDSSFPTHCDEEILIGRISVNFKSYNACEKNAPISMTHKEFELLKYLWERKNKNVSRDELLKDVWGQEGFITTRTIDNFIVKLRQKLELEPTNPKILLTVHGIGYKLID